MAQCSKCGSPLSDAQKFCGVCGTVAEQAAPAAATPPEGTQPPAATPPPVPTTPPAATPPPVPATPQAFTPPTYPPQGYQQPVYAPGGGYPNAAWQTPKKSSKGLWIGIAASVLVLAIAAILIFVVFWDQVSGGGDGGGGSYANAQERLAASWANSENAANASGSYDIAVTLETDTSAMSAEDQQMAGLFAGPITASGTFATSQSPTAVDLTVAASLFGQGIDAGVRLLDGKPYILFSGQWYETDPDTMQSLTDSGTVPDVGAIKDVLTNLAVDPSAWLKDLKEVGSEKIDGVNSVHLSGTPDLVKMITDVTVLMQSPEGQNLLNAAGSAGRQFGPGHHRTHRRGARQTYRPSWTPCYRTPLWTCGCQRRTIRSASSRSL